MILKYRMRQFERDACVSGKSPIALVKMYWAFRDHWWREVSALPDPLSAAREELSSMTLFSLFLVSFMTFSVVQFAKGVNIGSLIKVSYKWYSGSRLGPHWKYNPNTCLHKMRKTTKTCQLRLSMFQSVRYRTSKYFHVHDNASCWLQWITSHAIQNNCLSSVECHIFNTWTERTLLSAVVNKGRVSIWYNSYTPVSQPYRIKWATYSACSLQGIPNFVS
jgi:hypothetical protein